MEMTPAQRIRAEAKEATRRALLALVQAIGSILWNGIGILDQPAATTRSFLKLLMNPA